MRKIISLIMVLFLTFGAIGCFFQLKKIDEGDNTSSSSGGTSIGKEESRESTSSGSGTSSGSTSESESESTSESESEMPQGKLLGSLEVGSKVKVSHSEMGDIEFLIVDKDHDGYPSNSTTLITEKIIAFRAFDAKEPDNSNSSRKSFGYERYSVSNLDQWLNSSAAAGQWYSARHSADNAPSVGFVASNAYDQEAGFLAGFDAAFVAVLKDTTIIVAKNPKNDGGGSESITRKIFLPSRIEIYGQRGALIAEGSRLSYFENPSETFDIRCEKRIAVISEYAASHSEYPETAGAAYKYWLRTVDSSSMSMVSYVLSDGKFDTSKSSYASNASGVRPLCNLSSDTKVSESPDENGYYSLVFN